LIFGPGKTALRISVVGQAYDIFDPLEEWYVAGLLADAATP
jgi:hypothetical protein